MNKFHRFYELGLGIVIGVSAILVITSFTMAVQSYESVCGGYKILRNNGIVTISAQGKTVVVDTSKIDRDMFIPTNSAAELQSFASSTAYTTVSGPAADTTPPTITLVSATAVCSTRSLTVCVNSDENGQVKMETGLTSNYGYSTNWSAIVANESACATQDMIVTKARPDDDNQRSFFERVRRYLITDVLAVPPKPGVTLYYKMSVSDSAGNESVYTGAVAIPSVCPF